MLKQLALIESDPQPQPGQDNRSSTNSVFDELPSEGKVVSVRIFNLRPDPEDPDLVVETTNQNVSCVMMWDRPAKGDPIVTALKDRSKVDPATLERGNDYYIAKPNGAAGENFFVRFSGDI